MSQSAIQPAFADASRGAQAVFRSVMDAMSRPGRITPLDAGFAPPAPLNAAAAAILIALADFETPLWLDGPLARHGEVAEFLRFHTGAKLAPTPDAAAFAVIADPASAPTLGAFAQGTPDYPDRSTTVILQVERLTPDGWQIAGPGINGHAHFGATPLPGDLTHQFKNNRARFPLGVDLIFAGPSEIAALPRSTRILEAR
ncbi:MULTISPECIES: phosphonate C-P lyase system protein PhnH [Rhodomicrobium]|uniref:phosphonate C-P lyase system protein PhnH n=1 Tax=Rhodomicrobium TaxID=1068 RepID=UPI000B4B2762|nr:MULTISPECIES: phosphonate C-P lyase system protein PhnH [Rhodomicrobium]